MKQRFYFDTSVFGGAFEEKVKEFTLPLFERVRKGEITCVVSDLTERELAGAPRYVRDLKDSLPAEHLEQVTITDEMDALADLYIEAKVVGKTSREDCTHIACATIIRADKLVSWNFKHIVNLERIYGYNGVNRRYQYKQIEIYSPKDL